MRRTLLFVSMIVVLGTLAACQIEDILSRPPNREEIAPQSAPDLAPTPANLPSNAWRFREPRQPQALVEEADGFALAPGWQIAEVEYIYAESGFWEGSQMVRRDGAAYTRGSQRISISEEAMAAFVASIARFHPTQSYLYNYGWTHDHPTHKIEVTGEDGQRLLFISSSTGNHGDAPWNLIYNDRLYAQYDGAFGYGVNDIFLYEMRGTGPRAPGEPEKDNRKMHFATEGLPPQLVYGFNGLLPIADHFVYTADPDKGMIEGSFIGRYSFGGWNQRGVGMVSELHGMTLTADAPIACAYESMEMDDDPRGAGWTFSCNVGVVEEGTPFWYPMTLAMTDKNGNVRTVTGTLSGVWSAEPRLLRLDLPPFLRHALEANSDAAALLATHEYAQAGYNAALEPELPNAIDSLRGDLTLFGSTTYEGAPLRYRVTTSFVISETTGLQWRLTPDALETLVSDTLSLPETERLLKAQPDTLLELGYFPPTMHQEHYMDGYPWQFPTAYAATCPMDPAEAEQEFLGADTNTEAIRAVGYRFGANYLFGGIDDTGDFRASSGTLGLDEGSPAVHFPNGAILREGHLRFNRSGKVSSLSFGFDTANSTPERLLFFEMLGKSVGAEIHRTGSGEVASPRWWIAKAFTLEVLPSGELALVACE